MLKIFKNTIILLTALFTVLSGVSLAIIPLTQSPIKGAVTIPSYYSNTKGALLVGIWKSSALSASGFNSVVMRKFLIPLTQKASGVIVPLDFSGVRLSNGTYYITAAAYTDALKALSYIPPNLKVMNTSIFKYGEYSDGLWGNPSPITYSGVQLTGLDFTLNMSPALTTGITKPPIDTTTTMPLIKETKPPIDTTMPPTEVTKPPINTTMPPTTTTVKPAASSPIAFNGKITFAAPGVESYLFVGVWPSNVFSDYFKNVYCNTYIISAGSTSASYSFPLYHPQLLKPMPTTTTTIPIPIPYFATGTNYYIVAYLLKGHGIQSPTSGPFPIRMQAGDLCGEFSDGNKPGINATPLLFQGATITSDFNLNYEIQSADITP